MIVPLIASVGLLSACSVLSKFAAVQPGDPGTLRLNVRREFQSPSRGPLIPFNKYGVLGKRDDSGLLSVDTLSIDGIFYVVDVSVGTPPQDLQLVIDTGSSDAWVLSSDVDLCDGQSDLISSVSAAAAAQSTDCLGGLFDSSSSSTFVANESFIFNISYGDGSGATGYYAQDVFSIGGAQLDNFTFGVANDSSADEGILGVGLPSLEASNDNSDPSDVPSTYSNLPQAMVSAGIIQSPVFSLFLDSINDTSGTILFGGYDPSRIDGPIQELPFVRSSSGAAVSSYYVGLIGFGVTSNGQSNKLTSDDFALPALLDSGTTLSYLPTDLVKTLVDAYGAEYNEDTGVFLVDCEERNQEVTFDYYFDGITINVDSSQAIVPFYDSNGDPMQINGTDICMFGFYPSDEDTILGDAFLRSAYIIYDLENLQAGMAQAAYPSSSGGSIQTVGSSGVLSASPASTTYTAEAEDVNTSVTDSRGGRTTVTTEAGSVPTQTAASMVSGTLVSSLDLQGTATTSGASATSSGSHSQKNLSTRNVGDARGHTIIAATATGMIAIFFVIVL